LSVFNHDPFFQYDAIGCDIIKINTGKLH